MHLTEPIIGGRFILTLKNYGTPSKISKVSYMPQEFNENDQSYIVYHTAALRATSIHLILSLSTIGKFWSLDMMWYKRTYKVSMDYHAAFMNNRKRSIYHSSI